ncbi:ATP-dependent DNA helicase PIF1-like [Brachypodium distachyon]|uniref:ATP-dependent DNA helicase PIF1-like n=1 Tax=Brachypodium distachyon TaxID=15368 RepID=UPI00052FF9B7|nr:ATP-dependent DNA helicase PIF1-like [Brachypodium distachyon]|eukprot:XP_010239124.1 ATP-dependent DNA helicase PIF1-like [Brachypodium distachyon]
MDSKYKLKVPEQYDRLISAELPDKHKYPELYAMVVKHMMHGPCGVLKPNNVCMKDGLCKNLYLRPFNSTTIQGKDSYPVYHRRDNGRNAHVRGCTSFEDMQTVDVVLCETLREAAEKRGLIEADNALDECLTEAEQFAMPSSLRRLFATILVFCEPGDPRGLWDRHLEGMSEDYRQYITSPITVEQKGDHRGVSIAVDIEDASLASSINPEQRSAYDEILAAVDSGTGGVFFVDGPGGTGKTFLYRALLAKIRGEEKIAVATTTAGIAASIMPGGSTAHSRFKIPLNIVDGASCNFTKQSGMAKLLRMASHIIWDEATMTKHQAIEALDNSMRDIMGRRDRPFGGKTVVFGGDFRQVLSVVRKGTRGQIIDASLRSSYLSEKMRHLKLVTNMRAHSDPWFADFLLRVGNGTEEADGEGNIRLPKDVCVPSTDKESDIERLIDHVFPDLNTSMANPNYITSRAILTTKNDNVDNINMRIIERFNGEEIIYHSFDSAEDDPHGYYPPEFLNTLTPNGLPPHVLKLKINCPVILLRNIDPANGLCNGTRLIVRGLQKMQLMLRSC